MFLIIANDINLINYQISEILKSRNILDFNRSDFSDENDLEQILNFLNQESLFEEKNKICVVDISNFVKNKKNSNVILELLTNLSELQTDNKIIIIRSNYKLNSEIQLDKYFEQVYELSDITNKNKLTFIQDILKQKKLSLTPIKLSIIDTKLPKNISIIKNELNKLNANNIDRADEIICDYNETKIFNVITYYLQKDYVNLFKLIDRIFVNEDNTLILFNYLCSKVLNLFLIKKATLIQWDIDKIASEFNLNRFVVMNDIKLVSSINIEDIENILYNLYYIEKISRTYYSDIRCLLKTLFLEVRIK